MSKISEADGSPISLKDSRVYEIEYNKLAGYKEMADTGLAELPQSNHSFGQNIITRSTVGNNSSTAAASSQGSSASKTLVTDLSSDGTTRSWTKYSRARAQHPRFCDEFVASPVSIPRLPPDLHRPLPPIPKNADSARISQISQLIEMYIRQEKRAFKVVEKPVPRVPRQEDQKMLGNFL